jgi:secreted protein with Ig-like and vWFA domain
MKTETDFPPADESRLRATAWALGQLSPEDQAAFEAEMQADPDLAAYARDMREFSCLLAEEFPPAEEMLPQETRAKVIQALSVAGQKPTPSFLQKHWQTAALLGAAACAVVAMKPDLIGWKSAGQSGPELVEATESSPITPTPGFVISPIVTPTPPLAEPMIAVRPAMPKPLFVGTPLPQMALPPNFDQSGVPILEVQVPAGTSLISRGKPVTSNDTAPIGDLSLVTDGDKQGDDGYFVDLMPGKAWVQIDLETSHEIWLLWVWHFHKQNVIFNDVIVQISDDPAFATSQTVFNNDYDNSMGMGVGNDQSYIETNNGRPMPVNGVKGRYVRFYSNGRDLDDTNQYIDAEVYGRPAVPDKILLAEMPLASATKEADTPLSLAKAVTPSVQTVNGPVSLSETSTAIRPAMPKPLFVGTPLPRGSMPAAPLDNNLSSSRSRVGIAAAAGNGPTLGRSLDIALAADRMTYDPMVQAESYQAISSNKFQKVTDAPLSTFSIDVDTASYANVRRFLNAGLRPPAEAVRLEELVNYFTYEEAPPQDGKPFAVKVDLTAAPWNPEHRLARIVLKGKEIAAAQRPVSNLVFLVDVSGSMADPNKLPLVQQSLRLLTDQLTENDRVSLVTYAGSTAVVLPSTNGQEKAKIRSAIDALNSNGSTNGAGGLTLAYQQAAAHFIKDGVNRVILATDGDFNVGISSHEELLTLIQDKAKSGVFLSVLGYGTGNLKDDTMELLADKGNGNYAYIDSISEARKALVEQMSGTLVTIAKDVKIQIEFNPAVVQSWRLLGYENRLLAKEDFNDDKKDAGEIGAGHQVTALYEIVPVGVVDQNLPVVDGLKYQQVPAVTAPKVEPTPAALTGELMNVKLRYKEPAGEVSQLLEVPVKNDAVPFDQISQEARWATAVAAFAQRLRGETNAITLTWEQIRQLARSAKGPDALGYRGEFLQLIDKAEAVCP